MKVRILLMLIVSLFAVGGMTLAVYAADKDLSRKDKDFVKKAADGRHDGGSAWQNGPGEGPVAGCKRFWRADGQGSQLGQ